LDPNAETGDSRKLNKNVYLTGRTGTQVTSINTEKTELHDIDKQGTDKNRTENQDLYTNRVTRG